jgi:hypothetical protein
VGTDGDVDHRHTVAVRSARSSVHQLRVRRRFAAARVRDPAGRFRDISLKSDQTSNSFIAWSNPTLGSYNQSSLVYGDYYYTFHDRGFFTANDAKTGEQVYGRRRISEEASGFSASPWAYNGKIFALSEYGDTFVIGAGPEFKLLGKNSIGERTLATPAIVGNSVIIRTASNLLRITKSR